MASRLAPRLPPVKTPQPAPFPTGTPSVTPPSGSPKSPQTQAPPPPAPNISLHQPTAKKGASRPGKLFRQVRSVFRSFPIITPRCKIPSPFHGTRLINDGTHIHGGTRMTGTLFGYRKARVNLTIQENPSSLPVLLLELTIPTGKLLQDMGLGLVRIALECEKRPNNDKTKIVEEPIWTMYCNGRKSGYGVKREPTDEDLAVMQTLHVVSMGAGVIPTRGGDGGGGGGGSEHQQLQGDGDLTYMRSHFERVIGSKDSETYYMMNPDGNNGPELSIFFVRI